MVSRSHPAPARSSPWASIDRAPPTYAGAAGSSGWRPTDARPMQMSRRARCGSSEGACRWPMPKLGIIVGIRRASHAVRRRRGGRGGTCDRRCGSAANLRISLHHRQQLRHAAMTQTGSELAAVAQRQLVVPGGAQFGVRRRGDRSRPEPAERSAVPRAAQRGEGGGSSASATIQRRVISTMAARTGLVGDTGEEAPGPRDGGGETAASGGGLRRR